MRVGPSVNALLQVAYAIPILANMIERESKKAARGATSNTATHSGVRTNGIKIMGSYLMRILEKKLEAKMALLLSNIGKFVQNK